MSFPRVLVVFLFRNNADDITNNGLLLRNLFGSWPREKLAQIYSCGDNGDAGAFGHYYQLGLNDRWLGSLFHRLKAEIQGNTAAGIAETAPGMRTPDRLSAIKTMGKRLLLETGFYEVIFRPRLSREMQAWVKNFRPDIILVQGYCLTFTWLSMMLASRFKLPVAYYPTDDWPNEAYRADKSKIPLISPLMSRIVSASARRLVSVSSVRIAFNRYMKEEYLKRYEKEFTVIMHGDDVSRLQAVKPMRLAGVDECWIVSTGLFGDH